MSRFKHENGDWTDYRKFSSCREIDFHHDGPRYGDYHAAMEAARDKAMQSLVSAQSDGIQYVILIHGNSTSRPGMVTQRSVIRGLMRSKDATPYIVRSECIQHPTVFVARIKGVDSESC